MKRYPPVADVKQWAESVSRLRAEDIAEIQGLKTLYVGGRLRTDRAVPTGNGDVVDTDRLGDIVRSAAYEYIIVDDSGTLKWARHALDVSW